MKEGITVKASLKNQRSENVIVTDMSSLRQLLAKPPRLWRQARISLRFEELTDSEAGSWQRTLNSHYSTCGCKAGTIVMAIAVESYVLFLSLGVEDVSDITWQHLVVGGLIGLLGAFVGRSWG